MKFILPFFVTALPLLAACSTTHLVYTHPTKAETEQKKDAVDCQVKLGQAQLVDMDQKSFYKTCMEALGYTSEEAPNSQGFSFK